MDELTLYEIKSLVGAGPVCVSLYMPILRGGAEAIDDPVRLAHLLRKAAQELQQRGHEATWIDDLMKPARAILEDTAFWAHPEDGLVLFLAPGLLRRYRLPRCFEETI